MLEQHLVNPKHYRMPLSTRVRCPICHEAVYSRAGIHPQCAVRQSEPPRTKTPPAEVLVPVEASGESIEAVGADDALIS